MKEGRNYIYLFRHGQTTYNRDRRFTGIHDPSLTSLGKKQAQLIAKKLKNKKFQLSYHTSLKRSKQTLAIVLKNHPECKEIKEDNRIIERNYGALNGTTHQKFIEKMGKKLYKLEVEGDFLTELSKNQRKKIETFLGSEEYEAIHRGFNVPPPQGESFADVEKRVKSFINFLIPIIKERRINIAISAHGNSIRLFRKIMEKSSIKKTCSWTIPYDKVFIYSIS